MMSAGITAVVQQLEYVDTFSNCSSGESGVLEAAYGPWWCSRRTGVVQDNNKGING